MGTGEEWAEETKENPATDWWGWGEGNGREDVFGKV